MAHGQNERGALALTRLTPAEAEAVDLKIQVSEWIEKADEAVEASTALVVRDEGSSKGAIDFAAAVKRTFKEVEDTRATYKAPVLILGRRIDALFAPILEKLKTAERTTKEKLGQYDAEKRAAQEKERLRLEREYQAKLAREEKKAEKRGTEAVYVPPPVMPEERKTAHGDSASATVKRPWRHEVVDEEKVPRAFCSPDSKKIKAAVESGIREIPGCRIFQATEVSVR